MYRVLLCDYICVYRVLLCELRGSVVHLDFVVNEGGGVVVELAV